MEGVDNSTPVQGDDLNDLQSYLVSFNKEIEHNGNETYTIDEDGTRRIVIQPTSTIQREDNFEEHDGSQFDNVKIESEQQASLDSSKELVEPSHDLADEKTDLIQAEKSPDGRGIQQTQESNELGHDVHSQVMQVPNVTQDVHLMPGGSANTQSLMQVGGAHQGTELVQVAGPSKGTELIQVAGPSKGAELIQVHGPSQGVELVQVGGAPQGTELMQVAGSSQGAELIQVAGPSQGAELMAIAGSSQGAELIQIAGPSQGDGLMTIGGDQEVELVPVDMEAGLPKLTPIPIEAMQSQKGTYMKFAIPSSAGEGGEHKFVQVMTINGQEHVQLIDPNQRTLTQDGQVLQLPSVSTAGLATPVVMEQGDNRGDIDGTDPVAVLASVAANTSSVNQIQTDNLVQELTQAQMVALQNTSDSSQPQLVAVQSPDGLNSVMSAVDGVGDNFQTVTIVPSEISQNGEMRYVLIVSQPDKDQEEGQELRQEDLEQVIEEVVDEDGVTRHIIKITQKKNPYTTAAVQSQLMCNYCTYTSPKRYLLMRHMKTHSEDRPHQCNICNRAFKTMASLQNHVNTHTGVKPHKCKDCESCFTTSGELVRHIRYKHTLEKPHKCTECDYASVELSKLKRHIRSHTGERPYQCPHCNYASPDTYKLKRHLRIHTGEKPYECNVCHAHFTQSNSLKAHKLIHSGNKPVYQCELCPTTCGRKTDLKIHMHKLHNSEKPLDCKKCDETFPDRYTFKLHMKSHEGEKCFKCNICEYAAQSLRHLESHLLVHTGQRPFECGECDQSFRQKQLLKRHMQLYHNIEQSPDESPVAEKFYECSQCPRSFAYKGSLVRHEQTHLPNPVPSHLTTMESIQPSVTSLPQLSSTSMSADHLITGSLLNEMKEGKLGNTPKIVIVHPDGRVEEVTARLQSLAQEKVLEEVMMADLDGDEVSAINNATKAAEGNNEDTSCSTLNLEDAITLPNSMLQQNPEDIDEHKDVETQAALETDSEASSDSQLRAVQGENEFIPMTTTADISLKMKHEEGEEYGSETPSKKMRTT